MASLVKLPGRHFVIRCSKKSFAAARTLFEQDIVSSRIVTLKPPPSIQNEIRELSLPKPITVRFVSVRLSTGELEVLVTSLVDEKLYSTEMFKEIYHLRWGVEGFYGLIKERLNGDKLFRENGVICETGFLFNPFSDWLGIDINTVC